MRVDHVFARIAGVVVAPDLSVIIADNGNREIRVFRRDGAFSHRIGGSRGYNEFDRPTALGLLGDTLWVIDAGLTFLFARDGRRIKTIGTEPRAFLTALLPGGGALGVKSAPFGSGQEFRDEKHAIVRTDRAGKSDDTIAWVPSKNANLALQHPEGGFTIGRQRFSDAGITIVAPNAQQFFVVDRSVSSKPDSAVFRVAAMRANGDTLWQRSYRYAPRKLDKAQADSLLEALVPVLIRNGHTPGAVRHAIFIPDYYTPVTSAVATTDGSLWLRREDRTPTVDYWVLNNAGQLIATLNVPPNMTLMAVTESHAWAMETNQNVAVVTRYRIVR